MLTTNSNVVECLDVTKKRGGGPKTPEGKARSARNAVKHGLTARTVVLSGEDAEAYEARRVAWKRDYGVKDQIEADLIDRAVAASWRLERSVRGETARLQEKSEKALIVYDLTEGEKAAALGRRLLAVSGKFRHRTKDQFAKKFFDVTDTDPSVIVRRLKSFSQGVDWLIGRWEGLAAELGRAGFWHPTQEWEAMRLLGLTEDQILHQSVLVRLVLAQQMLCPSVEDPVMEAMGEDLTFLVLGKAMRSSRFDVAFEVRSKWVEGLKPKNKAEALAILKTILTEQILDLKTLKMLKLDQIEELSRLGVEDRALVDDSQEGVLALRYETAADREFHRAINAFYKKRKEERAGVVAPAPLVVEPAVVEVPEVVSEPSPSKLRNELAPVVRSGSRKQLRAEKKRVRELSKRSLRKGLGEKMVDLKERESLGG